MIRHEVVLQAGSDDRTLRLPRRGIVEVRLQGRWISGEVDGASLTVEGVDGEPTVSIPADLLSGLRCRWLDDGSQE